MKFKTNIRHRVVRIYGKYYYRCNHAVGKLSKEQIFSKTGYKSIEVTCKNCLRWK